MNVGDVRRWDFQADVYETPYQLVENLGEGRWAIVQLPPDEAVLDSVLKLAPAMGLSVDDEFARLEAEAGYESIVRFVSPEVRNLVF